MQWGCSLHQNLLQRLRSLLLLFQLYLLVVARECVTARKRNNPGFETLAFVYFHSRCVDKQCFTYWLSPSAKFLFMFSVLPPHYSRPLLVLVYHTSLYIAIVVIFVSCPSLRSLSFFTLATPFHIFFRVSIHPSHGLST